MKKKIEFAKPIVSKKTLKYLKEVLNSTRFSHGKYALKLEDKFSKFVNSSSAVAVSSCTTGLTLCFRQCGVKKGDEVIVPALTHVASAHSAAYLGAKIRFADVDIKTGNINIDQIKKLITNKTVAICIVHFSGLTPWLGYSKRASR